MTFDYSRNERKLMAIITASSNLASIPILLLCKKQKNTYTFYLACFSMITSIFYHIGESLDVIIFLPQLKWHELDNIAAICSINSLILMFSSNFFSEQNTNALNYISLFLSLWFEQRGPWNIINTIAPIFIFAIYCFYDWFKKGLPKCNKNSMKYGIGVFILAVAMFIKGLDDRNDYLRIYHSLWHITIGISTFYLWQLQNKKTYDMKYILINTLNILCDY